MRGIRWPASLPAWSRARFVRLALATLALAVVAIAFAASQSGCAMTPVVTTPTTLVACRAPAPAIAGAVQVRWILPASAADQDALSAWCEAVGTPIIRNVAVAPTPRVDEIAVVSWNVHVGAGDVAGVVSRLRAGAFTGGRPVRHFVLLLQEVYRADPSLPRASGLRAFAAAIRPAFAGRPRQDITSVAEQLGLSLFYAPSMRNGEPLSTDEDRGNAILSTLPLSDLHAIELPFERQRRVALAARIDGRSPSGTPWSLLLATTHLDTLAGPHFAFVLTGPARVRQVRGLLTALPAQAPTVLGGDLNSLLGYGDPAVREALRAFPQTPLDDRRPTFAGLLRLDHLFVRLPHGWTSHVRRLDDRFGSDHYPLLGTIRVARS